MWIIRAHGTREGVLKQIQAAKAAESSDQAQIESAKTLLISELSALDQKFNGAEVRANGDDRPSIGRVLQLFVKGQTVHV